jgi:hypothetical protein
VDTSRPCQHHWQPALRQASVASYWDITPELRFSEDGPDKTGAARLAGRREHPLFVTDFHETGGSVWRFCSFSRIQNIVLDLTMAGEVSALHLTAAFGYRLFGINGQKRPSRKG